MASTMSTMGSHSPPIMIESHTKWAKPEDWDKYRNTITALFMCHSLPNVIRIMREEHQFYATCALPPLPVRARPGRD